MSTYEKTADGKMLFEIIFGKEKAVSETGNQVLKGDTIPVVKSFPIIINQRAVLTKKQFWRYKFLLSYNQLIINYLYNKFSKVQQFLM